MEDIGSVIRYYRKIRGLTQLNLAMRLGVTPQTVGKWERRESEPDFTLLCPLAEALDVTFDTLFGTENKQGYSEVNFRPDKLRENLKSFRIAAGLTQAELAGRLEVLPQTVSKWETGVCAPDIYFLKQLCACYGIAPCELFVGRAQPPAKRNSAGRYVKAGGKRKSFSSRIIRLVAAAMIVPIILAAVVVPIFLASDKNLSVVPGAEASSPAPGQLTETSGKPENSGGDTSNGGTSDNTGDTAQPDGGGEDKEPDSETPDEPQDKEEDKAPEDKEEGNDPVVPPEEIRYCTMKIYDDFGRWYISDSKTLYLDDRIQEGTVIDKPDLFAPDQNYTITGFTDEYGNAVSFPITVTDDVTLYTVTEAHWLDWRECETYEDVKRTRAINEYFLDVKNFAIGAALFYDEFNRALQANPDIPRAALFEIVQESGGITLEHGDIYADAENKGQVVLPHPVLNLFPEACFEGLNSNDASMLREWMCDKTVNPALSVIYVFLNEDIPLKSGFAAAMKRFDGFFKIAHEIAAAEYTAFKETFADTEQIDFPQIYFKEIIY